MYYLTIFFSLVHLLLLIASNGIPFNYCCDDSSSCDEWIENRRTNPCNVWMKNKCCGRNQKRDCSFKEVDQYLEH